MTTVEQLESRRMMSVSASVAGGDLYVNGDAFANGISVEKVGTNLVVKTYQGAAGYQPIFSVFAAGVGNVRVYGYDGADTITLHNSVATTTYVHGGRGADFIQAGGGTTYAFGHGNWSGDWTGSHNPALDDNAADSLVAGPGSSWLHGQGGNDLIYFNSAFADAAQDRGYGGAGNDSFHFTGSGDAKAMGEGGDDTFKMYYTAVTQNAQLFGGTGIDKVDYAAWTVGVYVKADGATKSGPMWSASDGQRKHVVSADVETIVGTQHRDSLSASEHGGNLFGLAAFDSLYGKAGRDFIDGGDGDDNLNGAQNNDTLFGGNGNDTVYGDSGNDVVKGDAGNDSLYGWTGHDTIRGGTGNDALWGQDHDDHLHGEAGHDHLYAGGGYNLLVGGRGSDYLDARNGHWSDTLFGDDQDGGTNYGDVDAAYVDRIFNGTAFNTDNRIGVESYSY